jgi:hypothetical protein
MAKHTSSRETLGSSQRSPQESALLSIQESLDALIDAYKRQFDEILLQVSDHQRSIREALERATLLTREEAAERLCMSLSNLDSLVKKGAITVVYCDRRPRFHLTEIVRFIEAHTRRGRG